MLFWTLIFLICAIAAGAFGFSGIAGTAGSIAKVLFYISLVLLGLSIILGKSVLTPHKGPEQRGGH